MDNKALYEEKIMLTNALVLSNALIAEGLHSVTLTVTADLVNEANKTSEIAVEPLLAAKEYKGRVKVVADVNSPYIPFKYAFESDEKTKDFEPKYSFSVGITREADLISPNLFVRRVLAPLFKESYENKVFSKLCKFLVGNLYTTNVTSSELQQETGLSKKTVRASLLTLEDKGLIERRSEPVYTEDSVLPPRNGWAITEKGRQRTEYKELEETWESSLREAASC